MAPPRPRPDLSLTRVEQEAVVLDEAGGQVHVLNATAAELWERLERGETLEQAVQDLAEVHAQSPERVRADVRACIEQMAALGLFAPDEEGA